MHKSLHSRDDADRQYVSRKEGGRRQASIEDSVDISMQWLEDYIEKRGGRLITATRNKTNDTRNENNQKTKVARKPTLRTFYATNQRHLIRENVDVSKKRNLKREAISLLIAVQKNTIRTNHIKARLDKTQQNSRCSLCCKRDDTIKHIMSECSKFTQREYKTKHDCVGKVIHWELYKNFNSTIRKNGICTTQNISWKMRRTHSSGVLRCKQITKSRPDNKSNLRSSLLRCGTRPNEWGTQWDDQTTRSYNNQQ